MPLSSPGLATAEVGLYSRPAYEALSDGGG